jgi:CHAT domain-containing protein
LFRSFHKNLRAGARACDALRSAQVACLHSPDQRDRSPNVWGSVTLIGRP